LDGGWGCRRLATWWAEIWVAARSPWLRVRRRGVCKSLVTGSWLVVDWLDLLVVRARVLVLVLARGGWCRRGCRVGGTLRGLALCGGTLRGVAGKLVAVGTSGGMGVGLGGELDLACRLGGTVVLGVGPGWGLDLARRLAGTVVQLEAGTGGDGTLRGGTGPEAERGCLV
jgi:hypothetical protein